RESLACAAGVLRDDLAASVPEVTSSAGDREDVCLPRREVEWARNGHAAGAELGSEIALADPEHLRGHYAEAAYRADAVLCAGSEQRATDHKLVAGGVSACRVESQELLVSALLDCADRHRVREVPGVRVSCTGDTKCRHRGDHHCEALAHVVPPALVCCACLGSATLARHKRRPAEPHASPTLRGEKTIGSRPS